LARAQSVGVAVVIFPELAITGYTCADLFHQILLQNAARTALEKITEATKSAYSGLAVVGLPVVVDDQLFNCAAMLHRGRILGLIPKAFLPNYKEFYEQRWFSPAVNGRSKEVTLNGQTVPFGADMLFSAADAEGLTIGIEICEDLWMPVPPSSHQALNGPTILLNLSATNQLIAKSQ